jgi:hypothetical protein
MRNPWLKKNPFMSMWLSGANSIYAAARGRATAEAHRQIAQMMTDASQQAVKFWSGGLLMAPPTKRRKRKR